MFSSPPRNKSTRPDDGSEGTSGTSESQNKKISSSSSGIESKTSRKRKSSKARTTTHSPVMSDAGLPFETLELIYKKAPVSIYLVGVNADGTFSYLMGNQRFYERNNFASEDLKDGLTIHQHLSKQHADKMADHLQTCIITGRTHSYETEIQLPIGRRAIHNSVEPLFDDAGNVTRLLVISTDITEHKRVSHQLGLEAARNKALAEISKLALSCHNLNEFFTSISERLAKALDIEFTEIQALDEDGQSLTLVAGYGWQPEFIQTHKTALDGGKDTQTSHTMRSEEPIVVENVETDDRFAASELLSAHKIKSGISVFIEGISGPYAVLSAHSRRVKRFGTEDLEFFESIASTLSAAVKNFQADDALRQSEKLVSSILSSAEIGICVCDAQGRFVRTNSAFSEITGYEADELHGRPFTMLYSMNKREDLRRGFEHFISSNHKKITAEEFIQHKDGRSLEVLLKGSRLTPTPLPTSSANENQPRHMIFTISDITREKQNERNLRLLRSAVVHARDAVIIMNTGGYPPGPEILFVNQAFEDMTGYSSQEALGQSLILLDSKSTDPVALNRLNRSYKQAQEVEQDIVYQTKGGEDKWFNISLVPIYDEAEVHTNWLAILHDIGNRKENEQQLLADQERAQSANEAKTNFLAEMSHEIRTPLNAIIGFADFMKQEHLGPLGHDKYRDYIADIYQSGEILMELINSVLDLSKIEAGRAELYETTFDLSEAISSAVDLMQHRAENGGVKLNAEIATNLPEFHGDEIKIKQILLNLVSNAIKFTPREGSVTVQLDRNTDGDAILTVQDTGVGIDDSEIEQALSPYRHSDSGEMRRNTGTGLGLPVSKSLAEMHGGSLDLSSTPGEGTRVQVTLPASRFQ